MTSVATLVVAAVQTPALRFKNILDRLELSSFRISSTLCIRESRLREAVVQGTPVATVVGAAVQMNQKNTCAAFQDILELSSDRNSSALCIRENRVR